MKDRGRGDIEISLVEYNNVLARKGLDIRIDHNFKSKVTPKNSQSAYLFSRPCPVNVKEDFTMEPAQLQYYAINANLQISK